MLYEAALNLLPKRRSLARPTRSSSRVAESTEPESSTKVPDIPQFDDEDDQEDVAVQDGSEQEEALAENEKAEVLQLRSVLWANIGACHVKLVSCCRFFLTCQSSDNGGRSQASRRGLHSR